MNIWYFNPENDLALAAGSANYTAPPRAARLRRDLRLLPAWLAAAGDLVLCDDDGDRRWLRRLRPEVDIITPRQLAGLDDAVIMPWGWSAAAWRTLSLKGVPERLLPDFGHMETIRQLSHRRTTIAMHRYLQQHFPAVVAACSAPVELSTLDAVVRWADAHPGGFLKLPWSGSGQGVYRVLSMDDGHLWQWCRGGLRRQGTLLCEPGLDKIQDFATEWVCRRGEVSLMGFSVFESDFHHQYAGGLVDTRQALHDRLAARCPGVDAAVEAVRQTVAGVIAPRYEGYVGVDMMLFGDGGSGGVALAPCVEVNLRCTMGMVAGALGNRHGMRGRFCISDGPLPPGGRALTPPGGFTAVLCPDSNNE